MRRIVLLLALASLVAPGARHAGAADRPRAIVPLAIDAHGAVFVDVRVNGSGPYRFVLDTGSSRSIVSDALARELAAPAAAKSEVVTSTGSEVRVVVRLATLEVPPARVTDVLAPVLPEARLAQLGPRVRGLLGQDFLSAFDYTLDYRHGRLTWDAALPCAGPDAVKMFGAEGRFVMALPGEAGTPLRLVPDSGAEAPVLFRLGHPGETTSTIPRLRIGSVTMENVGAYVVERSDPHADGLFPLHHFSTVSFAAGGACLVARP